MSSFFPPAALEAHIPQPAGSRAASLLPPHPRAVKEWGDSQLEKNPSHSCGFGFFFTRFGLFTTILTRVSCPTFNSLLMREGKKGLVSSPSSSDVFCQCLRELWHKLKLQSFVFWGVKPPLFHSCLQITPPAKTAGALTLSRNGSKGPKSDPKITEFCSWPHRVAPQQDGDKFWRMPECYIRGSTIKYLRIPDEIIDMVKEEVVSKGRGRGGMQQQKQQKGRGVGGAGRGKNPIFFFGFSPSLESGGAGSLPFKFSFLCKERLLLLCFKPGAVSGRSWGCS